jgi:outer membrane protein assembly factor BamB
VRRRESATDSVTVLGVAGDRVILNDIGRAFLAERLEGGAQEGVLLRGTPIVIARPRLEQNWLVGVSPDGIAVVDAARGEPAFVVPGTSGSELDVRAEGDLLLVRGASRGSSGVYAEYARVFSREGRLVSEQRISGDSVVWLSAGKIVRQDEREPTIIAAADARTGSPAWQWTLPHSVEVPDARWVDGGLALAGGQGDTLFMRDVATGTDRPSVRIAGAQWVRPIAAGGDVALIEATMPPSRTSDRPTKLVAVDARTGAIRWQQPSLGRVGRARIVADAIVITFDSGEVAVRDPSDGRVVWHQGFTPFEFTVVSPAARVFPVTDAQNRLLGLVVSDRSSIVVVERGIARSHTERYRNTRSAHGRARCEETHAGQGWVRGLIVPLRLALCDRSRGGRDESSLGSRRSVGRGSQ